jgi:hypothetical protein
MAQAATCALSSFQGLMQVRERWRLLVVEPDLTFVFMLVLASGEQQETNPPTTHLASPAVNELPPLS